LNFWTKILTHTHSLTPTRSPTSTRPAGQILPCICSNVDDHDIISLFTTVGDSDVTGGRTLYYGGGSAFDKKDPAGTCGEVIAETPFKHGQYQVGPFESVVHGGETWTGHRGVLSFYLNEGILEHFRTYGTTHYDEARERMYE
jgi:hypothetical protein